jgi:hypothetical protein
MREERAMKRSVEALVIVEMVAVIVAMAIVGLCGVARAEPAQQFSFQVKTPRPGDLSVHVRLQAYDTTGVVPPTPTEFTMRLPSGVGVDEAFLHGDFFCNGIALRDALDAHPSGVEFTDRLANLEPFIRELERSHAKRDRAALPIAQACERARLGGGTGLIDARDALRVLTDPIPVRYSMFLSRGTIPGAILGFTVIGSADERAPIVRRYPVVAGVHAVLTENLVDDPTPDGLYGKKIVIYSGPINGFQVSIAEVDLRVRGLRLRKGECLRRGRGGRCVRRQRADASLFTIPRCPASGHLSAELFSAFPPPTPSLRSTLELPCPQYTS